MSNVCHEHPVCQASSNLLFDQVKRPLQFTDAEISAFELTLCSVDKINACQVLSACSFIFFKVPLYICAIMAVFQHDLFY